MNIKVFFIGLVICQVLVVASCAAVVTPAPVATTAPVLEATPTDVPDPDKPADAIPTEAPSGIDVIQTPDSNKSQQGDIASMDAMLKTLMAQNNFSGSVLIAKDGSVLIKHGYGLADDERQTPNTPETRYRLASITKQFTAVAILLLQEEGKLSVDDPICNYIPNCPESWQAIKIHHLLTHTAGLFDFRSFAKSGLTSTTPSTSAQVIARIEKVPPLFAPGSKWNYSNGNFMVAGYVVEQVSGQSYDHFLHDRIFEPLGMSNTGYAHDDSGLAVGYDYGSKRSIELDGSLPFAAAGLYSTVEDLYLYTEALNSGRLLSSQSLDALFGLHEQIGTAGGFSSTFQLPVFYGYGWAIASYGGHRMIGHDGWIEGYSGDVRLFPDDKLTVIVLMNRTQPYAPSVGDKILKLLFQST